MACKSSTSSATPPEYWSHTATTSVTSVTSAASAAGRTGNANGVFDNITVIRPRDLGRLPDRVGNMRFDHVNSRWVSVDEGTGMVASDPFEGLGDMSVDSIENAALVPAIMQRELEASIANLRKIEKRFVKSVAVQTLNPTVQHRTTQTTIEKKETQVPSEHTHSKRVTLSQMGVQTELMGDASISQIFEHFTSCSEEARNSGRSQAHTPDARLALDLRTTSLRKAKNTYSASLNLTTSFQKQQNRSLFDPRESSVEASLCPGTACHNTS